MSNPTARRALGGLRFAAIMIAVAVMSGCASHPKPALAPAPTAPPPPPRPAASAPPPTAESLSPLPGSERDFVVNVGDRVYFDFDQYALRPDAQPVLAAQADWLKRYPAVRVRIEGNCDDRGTREYNLALGARRANAIKEFLVSHGVDLGRITTISYGSEKPIDPGTGEASWQHNRNGHTVILSGAR